ncbi:hypothetical protein FHY52_30625 [Nocardia nova]|nr:hypothetical protein [Nocardia nova]
MGGSGPQAAGGGLGGRSPRFGLGRRRGETEARGGERRQGGKGEGCAGVSGHGLGLSARR